MTRNLVFSGVVASALFVRSAPADNPKTPVTVTVQGSGTIRLVVADGVSKPCEAGDNRILFSGYAKADAEINLSSQSGSVCVDHTYGAFRETQWAGASIWSGSTAAWSNVRVLKGSVSTEAP
jgi:hypothetical protein